MLRSRSSTRSLLPQVNKIYAHQIGHDSSSESEVVDIVHVHSVSPDIPMSYKVLTEINETPIAMELDTGAEVSIISEKMWSDKLQRPELQSCTLGLQSYSNKPLDGMHMRLKSVYTWKNSLTITSRCKGNRISLLGRNWLEDIKLDWSEVAKINGIIKAPYQERLDNLLKQYEEIFRNELGQCKHTVSK